MTETKDDWKVGDILVYNSPYLSGRRKIVRETATMWILDEGTKIRKGSRSSVGEHGYGKRYYYSIKEDEGKKINDSINSYTLSYEIAHYDFTKLTLDELKKVKALIDSFRMEKK